ncbi:hypothetical protein RUND412_000491 [Rhizina undulata]
MSTLPPPHLRQTLSLYRSLLRQAGVLYDDVARKWATEYIKRRFHLLSVEKFPMWRIRELLKLGRRGNSLLIRANAGDIKPSLKILSFAYGRVGRRRHKLLDPIIKYPAPLGEPLIPSDPRTHPPPMPDPLKALIQSQLGRNFKGSLTPKIAETNIWGRPMPLRRVNNMRWKHYTDILNKILAPLPRAELDRLTRFSRGEEMPIPPKRKVPLKEVPLPDFAKPRELTNRSRKRMWQRILKDCCSLEYDKLEDRWSVFWPDTRNLKLHEGDMSFFAGVTEKGKIVKERREGEFMTEKRGEKNITEKREGKMITEKREWKMITEKKGEKKFTEKREGKNFTEKKARPPRKG